MDINSHQPGPALYHKVRAGFVAQGKTLGAWCREHGHNPTNAKSCLIGAWNGPKGRQLRHDLIQASGINHFSQLTA